MRAVATLVAGVALLVGAAPAVAQTADDRITACIANNSVRYGEPSSATVAQYFSVASACRASIQGRPGIDVVLTPDATPVPNGGSSPGTPTAAGPDGAEGTEALAPGDASGRPTSAASPVSGAPTAPDGSPAANARAPAETARLVRGALASTETSGTAIASPVGALTPIGAGSLAAAALLGIGGFMRRRRYRN
jgi:hypothetical protein